MKFYQSIKNKKVIQEGHLFSASCMQVMQCRIQTGLRSEAILLYGFHQRMCQQKGFHVSKDCKLCGEVCGRCHIL
jgi:hypothetical protein